MLVRNFPFISVKYNEIFPDSFKENMNVKKLSNGFGKTLLL